MRINKSAIAILLPLTVIADSACGEGPATTCLLYGPSYQLASDTVEWAMTIARGHSCVRGLRNAYTTLDSTTIVVPPESGHVRLEGPGFLYSAADDFEGKDSFVIAVSGKLNKVNGSSTIRIVVSVR